MDKGKNFPYKTTRHCSPISHLPFADDILIFTNGSKKSLEELMLLIGEYEKISELLNKSISVFLVHKSMDRRKKVIEDVTCFKKRTTYLGVPLHYSTITSHMFQTLVAKIQKNVASWKGHFLSAGGKLILIKHFFIIFAGLFAFVFTPSKENYVGAIRVFVNGYGKI